MMIGVPGKEMKKMCRHQRSGVLRMMILVMMVVRELTTSRPRPRLPGGRPTIAGGSRMRVGRSRLLDAKYYPRRLRGGLVNPEHGKRQFFRDTKEDATSTTSLRSCGDFGRPRARRPPLGHTWLRRRTCTRARRCIRALLSWRVRTWARELCCGPEAWWALTAMSARALSSVAT